MTIPLTGNGGLFSRLGHLAGCQNDLLALAGGTATTNILSGGELTARFAQFQTDYAYTPVWTSILDGLFASFVTSGQGSVTTLVNTLNPIMQNTVIDMANGDTALLTQDLTHALQLLQAQMTGAANVLSTGAAAGAVTASGSPVGTPTFILSLLRGDGLSLEYVYPETLTFTCTQDQYSGGTKYQESFSITGQQVAQQFWTWPGGSGCNITISLVDGTVDYPNGGNLLVNSNFATVTNANIPDNWIKDVGTIGTAILVNSGVGYIANSNSLQFVGDGSTLTGVHQQFNTASSTSLGAGGTPATLSERVPYAVNFWYKLSGASPLAGNLHVSLTDTAGNVLNDDQSAANTLAVDLTAIADTNWHNAHVVFRVPTNSVTTTPQLRVSLATALSAGKTLYMDLFSMAKMTSLYGTLPQGPYVSGHSSNTPPVVGDTWTSAISSDLDLQSWQGWFQFAFNVANVQGSVPGLGIRLPTAGGATIAETLIA